MANADLSDLLESMSLQELKSLIAARENYDRLQKKKTALEKELDAVNRNIDHLLAPLQRIVRVRPPSSGVPRRRTAQLSIEKLIIEMIRENQRPMTVNEIAHTLLNEKQYRTTSGNFKNQLRVLLYRNRKGLFKKTDAGTFDLAGDVSGAGKRKAVPRRKQGDPAEGKSGAAAGKEKVKD